MKMVTAVLDHIMTKHGNVPPNTNLFLVDGSNLFFSDPAGQTFPLYTSQTIKDASKGDGNSTTGPVVVVCNGATYRKSIVPQMDDVLSRLSLLHGYKYYVYFCTVDLIPCSVAKEGEPCIDRLPVQDRRRSSSSSSTAQDNDKTLCVLNDKYSNKSPAMHLLCEFDDILLTKIHKIGTDHTTFNVVKVSHDKHVLKSEKDAKDAYYYFKEMGRSFTFNVFVESTEDGWRTVGS